jgi:hypothetical protein
VVLQSRYSVIFMKCAKYHRTPKNQPKCIIPGLGKILRSEGYVHMCKSRYIFDKMYMLDPGISHGSMKVYVIIRGKI